MANVRNDRRVKYTKNVLKSALIDLMEEKPIGKISIKEICEKADINRGTFYTHYVDQFDLQNQILEDMLSQVRTYLDEEPKQIDSTVALTMVFRFVRENRRAVSVLIGENSTIQMQKEILRFLQERDEFARIPNHEDGGYLYQFIANGCFGIISEWVVSGTETPEHMARLVRRLTSRGLADFA